DSAPRSPQGARPHPGPRRKLTPARSRGAGKRRRRNLTDRGEMMKARAIRIEKHGGPELMQLVEVKVAAPGPGEALVRQTACGVNFLDVYQRSGAYPMTGPMGVGNEAAGVVEAVGPDVSAIKPGDRV